MPSYHVDMGKAFDRIQLSFVVKMFNKMGIVGTFLNILKPFTIKPQLSSYLIEKTESLFTKVKHKTRFPTLTTIIQYCFGSPGLSS